MDAALEAALHQATLKKCFGETEVTHSVIFVDRPAKPDDSNSRVWIVDEERTATHLFSSPNLFLPVNGDLGEGLMHIYRPKKDERGACRVVCRVHVLLFVQQRERA